MNRSIRFRLFATLGTVLGFLVASANLIAAQDGSASIPVLPTVVVSAKAEIPVLATVVVTPSPEERDAALGALAAQRALNAGNGPNLMDEILPRARLDMPYYSFGRMMPRTAKD